MHNEWSITNISIWYMLRHLRLGCSGAASLWLAAMQPASGRLTLCVLIDRQWPILWGKLGRIWAEPQLDVRGGLAGIGLASLMAWAKASFDIGVLNP